MELSEILRLRGMVRTHRPEPIDQDALRRIVGGRAPCAQRVQPGTSSRRGDRCGSGGTRAG